MCVCMQLADLQVASALGALGSVRCPMASRGPQQAAGPRERCAHGFLEAEDAGGAPHSRDLKPRERVEGTRVGPAVLGPARGPPQTRQDRPASAGGWRQEGRRRPVPSAVPEHRAGLSNGAERREPSVCPAAVDQVAADGVGRPWRRPPSLAGRVRRAGLRLRLRSRSRRLLAPREWCPRSGWSSFLVAASPSSRPSCRRCLRVPGVCECDTLHLHGDHFVTSGQTSALESEPGTAGECPARDS
ncbi:uncharacterized protein LOC115072029 [Nannospalax galili]|uniref:uncharacterized protein LOC115072029 n=1 Tax=Nannospalax galili TaxID=1026970 RepID=UPI00111C68B2|nr:uncharacterized protein LOC115072029 [Nannospalax galili]XP_029424167.1 uncharacterized protein LOC115072029 [Nannospalax galili]